VTHPPAARGFTLIELMISVAVVGVLASVAIPSMQHAVLRAKTAERRDVMVRIRQAVQDYYMRNGALVAGGDYSDSGWNPAWPPTTAKRSMASMPVWNTYFTSTGSGGTIAMDLEGSVYYSYRFIVDDRARIGRVTVLAAGDLDGDGVTSYKTLVFERDADTLREVASAEFPPAGREDDATYGTF
jgi:prepilin-type N-terminal cleavage/methylation domain-containing protein